MMRSPWRRVGLRRQSGLRPLSRAYVWSNEKLTASGARQRHDLLERRQSMSGGWNCQPHYWILQSRGVRRRLDTPCKLPRVPSKFLGRSHLPTRYPEQIAPKFEEIARDSEKKARSFEKKARGFELSRSGV